MIEIGQLEQHFELIGIDNIAASEIYADHAVLEYVQSGERIRGRSNITASRQAYPGRPTRFAVRRCLMFGTSAVAELVMTIEGDQPHPVVVVLDTEGNSVIRERIYIAEPWPAPTYRSAWVEPLT